MHKKDSLEPQEMHPKVRTLSACVGAKQLPSPSFLQKEKGLCSCHLQSLNSYRKRKGETPTLECKYLAPGERDFIIYEWEQIASYPTYFNL